MDMLQVYAMECRLGFTPLPLREGLGEGILIWIEEPSPRPSLKGRGVRMLRKLHCAAGDAELVEGAEPAPGGPAVVWPAITRR